MGIFTFGHKPPLEGGFLRNFIPLRMSCRQTTRFSKSPVHPGRCLGVDEDEVTPGRDLFKDLGAESIDLLDIVFRLERNFGIKIRGRAFPENVSDPELADGSRPLRA